MRSAMHRADLVPPGRYRWQNMDGPAPLLDPASMQNFLTELVVAIIHTVILT